VYALSESDLRFIPDYLVVFTLLSEHNTFIKKILLDGLKFYTEADNLGDDENKKNASWTKYREDLYKKELQILASYR